jgi:NAD-dependent deacetylase
MTKLPESAPVADVVVDAATDAETPRQEAAPTEQEPVIPSALPGLIARARHIVVLSSGENSAHLPPASTDGRTSAQIASELASSNAFRLDPKRVWNWYEQRREHIVKVMPGTLHKALALFENRVRNFTLITESVDGLHHRAGSDNVIELNGSLHDTICATEGTRVTSWTAALGDAPRCAQCGDFLRPDVVWAGETLPVAALAQAQQAVRECELLFVIGDVENGSPAASLRSMAFAHGATLVHIGPDVENRHIPPVMRIKGDPADVLMAIARVG